MQTLRALLNWRSLRWKITLLVAVAGCAIALTVGLLVHRSTYEWSMNTDAAQAYSALRTALASDSGSAASQLIADPRAVPPDLVRMARARGTARLVRQPSFQAPDGTSAPECARRRSISS